MVTEDELFTMCPPRRPLAVIPQLQSAVEGVADGTYVPPKDSRDLRLLLHSDLREKSVKVYTPFSLLARIHYVEHRPKRPMHGVETEYNEVSRPIHLRDGEEITIESGWTTSPPESPKLRTAYYEAMSKTAHDNAAELKDSYATYEDIIAINRRLVDINARCIPCRDMSQVACFRYDWLKQEVL